MSEGEKKAKQENEPARASGPTGEHKEAEHMKVLLRNTSHNPRPSASYSYSGIKA